MNTKILTGFEKYIIYDDGRVWSISKNCFMRLALTTDGYHQSMFINQNASNGYRTSIKVHRLVAMAFVPNPNNLKEVNHIDGDKTNNHYSNLEWCTRSENLRHCHALGLRSSKGARNGNYKHGNCVKA